MDDLFEQLKAEPPVNKYVRDAPEVKKVTSEITSNTCLSPRRESMPPPTSVVVIQKSNKSRSLSPPKAAVGSIKNVKVMIQRKNLANIVAVKPKNSEFVPPKPKEQERKRKVSTSVKDDKAPTPEKTPMQSPVKKPRPSPAKVEEAPSVIKPEAAIKKMTPTKAQQKLFEPPVVPVKVAVQLPKKFKVKRCMVRVRQDNLEKLQKEHVGSKERRGRPKKSPQVALKRKMTKGNTSDQDSPPAKKQRSPQTEKNKPTAGFFIKLTTSPSTGFGSKRNNNKKSPPKADKSQKSPSSSPLTTPSKNLHKKSSTKDKSLSASKKHASHTPKSTTKPTKFTRTQLIKAFGKRYFRSRVKIERCKHPMMLTFESNARARRLQTKRNKSKNLSVSFREQVEIFGDYDSESEVDNESEADVSMNVSAVAETSSVLPNQAAGAMQKSLPFPSNPMPVMPARLKKVENGKLIDDIELDPSLFIDPSCAVSSTPFSSPGRKKREKKSYSVLKGDGTPSPRKEQLKLANEKLPPSGLRRLNIDMDDDDDEDDDCEYIVPIEIPQRRMSRANSGVDVAESVVEEPPVAEKLQPEVVKEIEDSTSKNPASDSSNSFTSALSNAAAPPLTGVEEDTNGETHVDETNKATPVQDENEESEVNAVTTNNICATLVPLANTDTPPPLLSTLTDLVDAAINNGDELMATNDDVDNLDDIVSNKLGSTLDSSVLPLNLFVEDSGQNSEFLDDSVVQKGTIIDSTVNETIDNLSKDLEMAETNAATKIPPAALKPTSAISKTARASE